nr:palindromic element RPE4 domain-containing protein [Rickettsia bellii]
MNKVASTGRLINISEIPNYSSLLSSRGLSTGSSNKSYKYKKLDLSRFMLDLVPKPRDDN